MTTPLVYQESPPPSLKIPAGQYRRPSFPNGPLGYMPVDSPATTLSQYGAFGNVIVAGSCPACRIGKLVTEYSYLTLCCVLCCFPCDIGKHRRCDNCGAYFK